MEVTDYDRYRFGLKVEVDLKTGCHEWTGTKTSGGYGQFSWAGKRLMAHRVAYEWAYGPILDGLLVCHACDNRKCVNADHLFSGTHKDNMQDALKKGRMKHRSRGRPPFFTERQRLVVEAYEAGESASNICKHLGLSRQGLLYIVKTHSTPRPRGRQPSAKHRPFSFPPGR